LLLLSHKGWVKLHIVVAEVLAMLPAATMLLPSGSRVMRQVLLKTTRAAKVSLRNEGKK
jgi:hypothetical protein